MRACWFVFPSFRWLHGHIGDQRFCIIPVFWSLVSLFCCCCCVYVGPSHRFYIATCVAGGARKCQNGQRLWFGLGFNFCFVSCAGGYVRVGARRRQKRPDNTAHPHKMWERQHAKTCISINSDKTSKNNNGPASILHCPKRHRRCMHLVNTGKNIEPICKG